VIETTSHALAPPVPTLELLWQDDATAVALLRDEQGGLTAAPLDAGLPAVADVGRA
jgi:hypothetical protein